MEAGMAPHCAIGRTHHFVCVLGAASVAQWCVHGAALGRHRQTTKTPLASQGAASGGLSFRFCPAK
eukprot:14868697-Alexandrium_andersonii.AAC.1